MSGRVEKSIGHTLYHAENIRVAVCHFLSGKADSMTVSHALDDLHICSVNQQLVAATIISHARDEECMVGPQVSTWRAAAKAIYEVMTYGPCGGGEVSTDTKKPPREERLERPKK